MNTKGWIERVILQRLTIKDGRQKHGYKSKNLYTSSLFGAYHILKYNEPYKDGPPNSTKTNVRRALSSLKRKGLIEKYTNPSKDKYSDRSYWQSATWDITPKGFEEVKMLNQKFLDDYKKLRKKYGKN